MLALLGEAEAHGALLACRSTVSRIARAGQLWALHLAGEEGAVAAAPLVVNAAGLCAREVARRIEGSPAEAIAPLHFAKGSYLALTGKAPFSRLVYPVPEPGGLGTHLTLDMAGQARFGPDVEWVDAPGYAVDPARRDAFAASIARYCPGIDAARLQPAYAGVRPKLAGPGEPAADFRIDGPGAHGIAGIVNLFGIESPGLTAALAIGERIADATR
jgi:L-2-hydroxyglutarate oxidase LhgO